MAGAAARTGRLVKPVLAMLALVTVPLPLLGSSFWAILEGLSSTGWQALWADPQTGAALALSLFSGLGATALSLGLAAWLLSHSFARPFWVRVVNSLAPLLAVPHAAFAIGWVLLLAPSGWLLRALSPWATGHAAPPPWPTTQDPWGVGLTIVLVAKELPFLLWAAATQLQRADVANDWTRQWQLARSMGYTPSAAWWRIVWPQLGRRLALPALAVLAYNLTVVDVALIIGPTSPPTLAVLAWQWLIDADPLRNAQGAAAAWLLASVVALIAWFAWQLSRLDYWKQRRTSGHGAQLQLGGMQSYRAAPACWLALLLLYAGVMLALIMGSVSGVWPFPDLVPSDWTWQAWASVLASTDTLGNTLGLGLLSSLAAWMWAIVWLECAPPTWDRRLQALINLPLVLPSVLWVVGMHALALRWQLDASLAGVALSHTLVAAPYVLLVLRPAYAGFDPRLRQISASMGHGDALFLWRVKWPLLRSALAYSLAVGFAVSVAQYLPTLFIGAGRINTLTTEAVTQAAGAQRSLASAYAWLQWLLPVLGFALASRIGQSRRWRHR